MKSFRHHAMTIAPELSDLTRELLQEIHRESHDFVLGRAQALTPVRSGRMRAAWQSVNTAAIERLQPSKVRNASPQAVIIDMGRRPSQNAFNVRRGKGYVVKAGKMLGSAQAPRGVKGPVLRELAGQEDALFDMARARVERKGER